MWPLPKQDEVNDLMTWQHDAILFARRTWRSLAYALAALTPIALIINPSWDLALQIQIFFGSLLAFDLLLGLAARLTLSFVEKDKRP
ncbi:hypothetical protein [Porphyrobacter sp. LM 6]|uniref:hypothetical protein n=1 Tax=Porphyrobacter sp. LM 6 TaxID=1896196 RepID=UPI0008472218|nr:hypothetical protein [Porphyrobacter sp. LM 6]AOL95396.1 hypothetical protein BG023_112485 [Porphyrobacter sp. LM 6]